MAESVFKNILGKEDKEKKAEGKEKPVLNDKCKGLPTSASDKASTSSGCKDDETKPRSVKPKTDKSVVKKQTILQISLLCFSETLKICNSLLKNWRTMLPTRYPTVLLDIWNLILEQMIH